MLLQSMSPREYDEGRRWWAFRCDGCGIERAMRAETPNDAAWGLRLKTVEIDDGGKPELYCRACQRKGT
jgi:hypothetical protein